MRLLALLAIAGCSSPPRAAVVPPSRPPPSVDAAVADAVAIVEPDATEEPAAAVVEPEAPPALDDVDTTIVASDLPADTAGFAKHERIKRGGEQLLALFVRDKKLSLSIVVNENGIVKSFPLGVIDSTPNNEIDSESFLPRNRIADYQGPIQFAIRVRRPKIAGPQQLVVYTMGPSVAVVTRPLAGGPWSKVLRLELNKDATFVAIGTTDPH